jgi:hypothetical protein
VGRVTTAPVPLPLGIRSADGIRLRRLSGRPVPMYLDETKTVGPVYWIRADMLGTDKLWADVGLYELLLEHVGGATDVTQVQVGVGSTPALDLGDLVTLEDLTAILTAERSSSDNAYARLAQDETVSGHWDFTVAPTINGVAIGSGGGVSTGTMNTAISTAINGEVTRANNAYASRTAAMNITGAWDFDIAPTVNGVPIGTGGGGGGTVDLSDYALTTYVDTEVAAVANRPAVAINAAGVVAELRWIEPGQTVPPPPTSGRRYDIELVEVTV